MKLLLGGVALKAFRNAKGLDLAEILNVEPVALRRGDGHLFICNRDAAGARVSGRELSDLGLPIARTIVSPVIMARRMGFLLYLRLTVIEAPKRHDKEHPRKLEMFGR